MIRRYGQQGFTLVELLVTVAIISLLATLAAPKLFAAVNQSKQARVDRDLRTIHDALERYYTNLGYYPNKLGDLINDGYLRATMKELKNEFQSPINKRYYFYAVDDNRPGEKAQHFILGRPGNSAAIGNHLHREGDLPQGRRPDWRAWGWYEYNSLSSDGLHLYVENDTEEMPDSDVPRSLSNYRHGCDGSPSPCDLWSN